MDTQQKESGKYSSSRPISTAQSSECDLNSVVKLARLNNQILTVSMQQLASDPDCLPFFKGKNVQLPLLKHEIDRRILKITAMINRKHKSRRAATEAADPHPLPEHKYTQTEAELAHVRGLEWLPAEESVLRPSQKVNILHDQFQSSRNDHKSIIKSGKRGNESMPRPAGVGRSRQTSLNFPQRGTNETNEMIQSNGFTFRAIEAEESPRSLEQQQLRESQEDKIFQGIDVVSEMEDMGTSNTFENKLSRVHSALVYTDHRSDASLSIYTDFSNGDLSRAEQSHRRQYGRKVKLSSGEILLGQPKGRVLVGEECVGRMRCEVEALIGRRRKEFVDNKVRLNVLRKIEQKYGQPYN